MQHLSNPRLLVIALLALLPQLLRAQSVGIGTATPSTKAALEISATDKGLLIPRLTAAQRTAITSPPQGLMVYQTDGTASGGTQTGFWYYAGTPAAWVFLSPAADNLGNHTATQNINLTDKLLVGGTAGLPGSAGLSVNSNGRVGIGNTSPGFLLDANGTINGSSIYASSKLALSFGIAPSNQNSFIGTGATTGINTNGAYNTAVGHGAAANLFDGSYNTALGVAAGYNFKDSQHNTAIGYYAGYSVSSTNAAANDSNDNTFVGYQNGQNANAAIGTTSLGANAGLNLRGGDYNTFLGTGADLSSLTQRTNATAIGYQAKVDADNALTLGGIGANAVSVGIATTAPNSRLAISPSTIEPKITLWDGGSTTTHYGFGISSGQLNYHVGNTGDVHAFFAGGKNGNGTELMRIVGNGRVGIGTSAPGATFEVRRGTATDGTAAFWGSTRTSHFNYATTEDTYLRGGKATSNVYINDNGGSVGIGTTTVPERLSVAGTARADVNNGSNAALIGANANTGGYATGVRGTAAGNGYGVFGIAGNGGYGVSGTADGSGGRGVDGFALDGTGVYAETESGYAIQAIVSNTGVNNGYALKAQATDGVGVLAVATTGNALRATAAGTVPAAVITQNGSGLALDVTRGAVRTKEVRTPSTGAHNMLATGYGMVSNGFALAVSSSSENFTVTTTPGLPGAYTLTFPHLSGVDLSDAFVIATPVPNVINTTDFVTTSGGANGVIYINTYQGNFNRINGSFKFILFAP